MAWMIRMMCALALVAAVLVADSNDAHASGPMNRNFGIGLSLGNPTSLTGKYYLDRDGAVSFHVGTYGYYGRHYGRPLFLAGEYTFNAWTFVENGTIKFPFYVGIGGMVLVGTGRYYHRGHWESYNFGFGARIPIGIALQWQRAPFELFLEMSPALTFVAYDRWNGSEFSTYFDIANFALGARFYF